MPLLGGRGGHGSGEHPGGVPPPQVVSQLVLFVVLCLGGRWFAFVVGGSKQALLSDVVLILCLGVMAIARDELWGSQVGCLVNGFVWK